MVRSFSFIDIHILQHATQDAFGPSSNDLHAQVQPFDTWQQHSHKLAVDPTPSTGHSPPNTFNKLPESQSLLRPNSHQLSPNMHPVSQTCTSNDDLGSDPSLTWLEQTQLSRWVSRDSLFEKAFQNDRQFRKIAAQDIFREAVSQRGDWLGERSGTRSTKIRTPIEDERERANGKRKGRPATLRLTKQQANLVADSDEVLVPIRLEIEVEHWKLRDTFTWNLKEPVLTPEVFAVHLCEDLILPSQAFTPLIVSAIKEQLEDYRLHENFTAHHSSTNSALDHDTSWWSVWRENPAKRLKLNHDHEDPEAEPVEQSLGDDELRIVINLDIISGLVHLLDRFEWEIGEPGNCPEAFAEIYANDLGLAGEFKTAIAHSIREQIEIYTKSLALVEHVRGLPVPNDELRYSFLGPITDPIRTAPSADDHTPFLALLTPDELDRQEKEHDREARRKRRQTRARRGVTLPDREAPRTVRTIIPRQGAKMVMAFMDENDDMVVPVQPVAEPYPIKESTVELPEPPTHPKRIFTTSKDHLLVEPAAPPGTGSTTPVKASAGHRSSRRLRGATIDNGPPADTPPRLSVTPAPTAAAASAQAENERESIQTPPATTGQKRNQALHSASKNAAGTAAGPSRSTRGVNWEAYGLHDPMINGVWHCSNCGCPEHVAVGRRKGPGGKDTLCGECGRYMHRFKKNRPALFNTSADYHTSLKLEADKAQQAIADQALLRKKKKQQESSSTVDPSAPDSNTKKRKKAIGTVLGRPRREASLGGSVKSAVSDSRESSPAVLRAEKRAAAKLIQMPSFKKVRVEPAEPIVAKEEELEPERSSGFSSAVAGPSAPPKVPPARPIPGPPPSLSSRTTPTSASSRPSDEQRAGEEERGSASMTIESPGERHPGSSVNANPPPVSSVASASMPVRPPAKRGRPRIHPLTTSPHTDTQSDRSKLRKAPGSTSKKVLQHPAKVGGPQPNVAGSSGGAVGVLAGPPDWMARALAELRGQYPTDRVELVPKMKKDSLGGTGAVGASVPAPGPGWRLKCLDCPGKLYTVGPDESFNNFVVHLKNRQHRQRVEERVSGSPSIASVIHVSGAEQEVDNRQVSLAEKDGASTESKQVSPIERQGGPPAETQGPMVVERERKVPSSAATTAALTAEQITPFAAPPPSVPPAVPSLVASLPSQQVILPPPHHHHYYQPSLPPVPPSSSTVHHRHGYNNNGNLQSAPLAPPTLVHPLPKKPML